MTPHWWVIRRHNDAAYTVALTDDDAQHYRDRPDLYEVVEVVPADGSRRAVDALAVIRDFDASQGAPIAPRENPTTAAMRQIATDALTDLEDTP